MPLGLTPAPDTTTAPLRGVWSQGRQAQWRAVARVCRSQRSSATRPETALPEWYNCPEAYDQDRDLLAIQAYCNQDRSEKVLNGCAGNDAMIFEEELDILIRSSYPIIYIPTPEEERAEQLIAAVAEHGNEPRSLHQWDFVNGFGNGAARNNPFQALEEIESTRPDLPALFVLRDFHRFLEDIQVARKLRNISRHLRSSRKTLIILAPSLRIPADLAEEITVLDLPAPTAREIDTELDELLGRVHVRLSSGGREALVKACQGLYMERIRLALARAIANYGGLDERAIQLVLEEKKQRIRRTQVLEFWPAAETLEDIGGLDILKAWLEQRAAAFTSEARQYGLPNPRGILLVGIQGTGKSLSAKATASLWQVPLLRLDIGRLMGGLVGESEARTREMIRLAEAMAPCVLFLDELDKGFAGVGGSFVGDSGTSARVFGTILTWMEEKESPVFIAATANAVEALPPEVLRKGRFDEIFFIDLPSERERREIFEVHLSKVRPNRIREFDLDNLAFQSEGFNGAEIEQTIFEAMHVAFSERREFTTDDLLRAMALIVPLSKTAGERIRRMQEWADSGRCRPASSEAAQSGLLGQLFGDASLPGG
jgi:ATP-dependent 26S proteasome regulatory subunit